MIRAPLIRWAVAAAVLLGACSSASAVSPDTTTTPVGSIPAEGELPSWASRLEPRLDEIVRRSATPSAIVLIRSGSFGDATYIYGSAELGGAEPVTTAHHYRVGSITKTVTATIILQLAQDDLVALDDAVSMYVAGVPDGDVITLADLLDMRSGSFNFVEDPEFLRAVATDPSKVWTPEELLDVAFAHPSYFPAGTEFHYSNTNYILLGLVMEQVTGQSASTLFTERVFEPLGMDDSSLPRPEDLSMDSPYAHGYGFGDIDDVLVDPALPASAQAEVAAGALLPDDWTDLGASPGTDGGMVSTADDLLVWADALVAGSVLNAETQQLRLASIRAADPSDPGGVGYGYGIAELGSYLFHDGGVPGYSSWMARDPDTATTIVVLAGLVFAPDGSAVAVELAEAAADGLPAHSTFEDHRSSR